MSAIAFCMDLILASLLLAALLVGIRLEKRLKTLRESQAGFAGAVTELNAAIARAEEGLAELKTAALDAQTTVADRIQDAKGMTARLEKQAAAAGEAAERLEKTLERYASFPLRDYPSARPVARDSLKSAESGDPGVLSLHQRVPNRAERGEAIPLRREALSRLEQQKSLEPRGRADERVMGTASRRPAADDELFDIIEPALRAARGMGR
jgi:hypothetical protein